MPIFVSQEFYRSLTEEVNVNQRKPNPLQNHSFQNQPLIYCQNDVMTCIRSLFHKIWQLLERNIWKPFSKDDYAKNGGPGDV